MPIPQPVLEISEFLSSSAVSLSSDLRDPRIDSAVNEDQLIDVIETNFIIQRPAMRNWWDLQRTVDGEPYPINIKVSNLLGNDNVQCKLGIYYSLTGLEPDFANEISWENFFEKLSLNLDSRTDRDYYFIIVNKNNSKDVFATSLKSIATLVPNGNNLPFQCKWGSNRTPVERTHEEASRFVLANLHKSCQLRSRISSEFEKFLGGYLGH